MRALKYITLLFITSLLLACGGGGGASGGDGNGGGETGGGSETPAPTGPGSDDEQPDDGPSPSEQPGEPAPGFTVSDRGRIEGRINLDAAVFQSLNMAAAQHVGLKQQATLSKSTMASRSKSAAGEAAGVWLVPPAVNAAAGVNDDVAQQADQPRANENAAWPPLVRAVPVSVDAEGHFVIDVPADSGYSLLVIDPQSREGARVEDITVESGETTEQNVEETDLVETGTAEIRVVAGEQPEPLPGAAVKLLDVDLALTTDASGMTEVSDLPAGRYAAHVRAAGYAPRYVSFVVAAGQANQVPDVRLSAAAGVLVGQIEAPALSNAANIPVYLRDADGGLHATLTTVGGTYRFPALPAGEDYSLIITAADHTPVKIDGVSIEANSTTSLPLATLTADKQTGSIVGHARYQDRAGSDSHAGILVSVEGTSKEAVTARDGAFIITGLQPGNYTLNFTDANHATATTDAVVSAATHTELDSIALNSLKGSVIGTVTKGQEEALANASVEILGSGLMATSSENGDFTFAAVPAGQYTLRASLDGYQSVQRAITVEADAELDLSEQPLVLNGYEFSGQVSLGEAADSHSGVQVNLSGTGLSALTDAEGAFSFSGVAPGNYQLQLARAGYVSQQVMFMFPQNQPSYQLPYSIDMTRAYGTLKGQVTLAGRDDHTGTIVNLAGTGYTATTDAAGYWSMTLPSGNYSADVNYSRAGFTAGSHSDAFELASGESVTVDTAELIRETGGISGLVQNNSGDALTGALVQIEGLGITATSQDAGEFTFADVPTGSYTATAYRDGYSIATSTVTVTTGEVADITSNPFQLQPYTFSGSISLGKEVTDSSGVLVTVAGNGTSASTQTDADGHFTFVGLAPGNYQLQASRSGYGSTQMLLALPAGEISYELPYDLMLDPVRGALQGIARLDGQTDHSGIWVGLKGTDIGTLTDATGRWNLAAPVGNYADGIEYSKNHYTSAAQPNTVTVTEFGTHTAMDVLLKQESAQLSGELEVVGVQDLENAAISVVGLSGDAEGVTSQLNPGADGSFSLNALPLGEYMLEISYGNGLHETVTMPIDLAAGQTDIELEPVTLRQSYIKINDDARYTNSAAVAVQLGNTDAATMELVVDGAAQGETAYTRESAVTFTAGDGEREVTARFWDSDGNALPEVSDSITLDTTLAAGSFSATGASTMGDNLKIRLDLGEQGAQATATVTGLFENLKLFDNGTMGDTAANDGVYERNFTVHKPVDINTTPTANVTDRAGNALAVSADNAVTLSTAPSVRSVRVSSNITEGTMTLSFSTNEPARTSLVYGASQQDQPNAEAISDSLATSHTVTLTGLAGNELTHFTITATDAASNSADHAGKGKLAPPTPEQISAQAGSEEIGVIWSEVTTEGMAGYNLYRKEAGGAFVRVNSDEPITNRYYLDENVVNDVEYSYRMAAVDVDGNESIQTEPISSTPSADLAGPTIVDTGVITDDQVWLQSRSPYQIVGNMRVREDSSLVLLPGVGIDLQGNGRFILVNGEVLGFGTPSQPLNIEASGYDAANGSDTPTAGSFLFPEGSGGAMVVASASISNVNIYRNYSSSYQRPDHKAPVTLINSDVVLENFTVVTDFHVSSMKGGTFEDSSNADGWRRSAYRTRISIGTAERVAFRTDNSSGVDDSSNFYYYGNYVAQIGLADSCTFEGGRYGITEAVKSHFEDTGVQPNQFVGSDHRLEIHDSVIERSWIYADYESQLDDYSRITMRYTALDSSSTLAARNYDIAYNYWGTLDVYDIAERTGYSRKPGNSLYPIISDADLRRADFDGDGIPDYRDWDVDNDGYSDLQEDLLSDQAFNLVYDPLDARSYPSDDAKDADMDGTADKNDSDIDGDAATNDEELAVGSDPYMFDTDGDGVTDGLEIELAYDPLDEINYPLTGRLRNVVIDSSNTDPEGWVHIHRDGAASEYENGESVQLEQVTVSPGTKLLLDADTYTTFRDSSMIGDSNNPIVIRSTGVGEGRVSFAGATEAEYINLKTSFGLSTSSNTTIESSDLSFGDGRFYGSIRHSAVFPSGYTYIYGTMRNSYVTGEDAIRNGEIFDSYLTNRSVYDARITRGFMANVAGGTYSISNSQLEHSIVKHPSAGSSTNATLKLSDVQMYSWGNTVAAFLEGSFVQEYQGTENYSGLGEPVDEEGDGLNETEFTLGGRTYTVDGIKNPSATAHYPDWIDDPAVTQYFWNPSQVGALWDPHNPEAFPEP